MASWANSRPLDKEAILRQNQAAESRSWWYYRTMPIRVWWRRRRAAKLRRAAMVVALNRAPALESYLADFHEVYLKAEREERLNDYLKGQWRVCELVWRVQMEELQRGELD